MAICIRLIMLGHAELGAGLSLPFLPNDLRNWSDKILVCNPLFTVWLHMLAILQ